MKRLAGLLLILMLVCSLSPALAQTAECPAGGFSVWMPDHFEEVQPDPLSDPDQCFYWHGKKLAVLGYVTFQGQVSLTDLPQVLTGSETESGYVSFNGMDMLLYQGAAGFRIWTGQEMPVEQIRALYFK